MFYVVEKKETLDLHPRFFGQHMRRIVETQLRDKVEGTCDRKYGFIIAVTKVDDLPQGLIRSDGSGYATFNVGYQCIVFRPFVGEVIDCVVKTVSKMGVFAEAGPVTIFISSHLLPDDFKFEVSYGQSFVSDDGRQKIQESSDLRIRIMGVRIDANQINCVGTMNEACLGVIDQIE